MATQLEKLKVGKSIYFFDVSETKTGSMVLNIVESRRNGEKFDRTKLTLFDEDIIKFAQSMVAVVGKLDPIGRNLREEEDRVHAIRDKYPNAFKVWSQKDDLDLTAMFMDQLSVEQISERLGRAPKAISIRMEKLELHQNLLE
ncbi:DUF3276 family protein [Persicobacter sp. CCB-QB2]|uniref:DUF3276 family protein n=1 Tax=Persicobacter sp. CCB-QB2 TaxID=1561025 RepID=UPI0006A9DC9B|nr:DUF3276 family protein [Persicobacter sp. CCB-QB2]